MTGYQLTGFFCCLLGRKFKNIAQKPRKQELCYNVERKSLKFQKRLFHNEIINSF
jgi:hypothetical protein